MRNDSGIRPLQCKVVLSIKEAEEKTQGGVYLPDSTKDREKYASEQGTVIAIGPGAFKDPEFGDVAPEVGDMVGIARYGGTNVKGRDGKEYRIVHDIDITGIIDA
jgi:chaperonin GroES